MRALLMAALLAGCSRADSAPKKLCKLVNATRLPDGRWGVELPIGEAVLKAHGARFEKYNVYPNGQGWSDILEQCLAKERWMREVELDPEAGAFHAWVKSDRAKDSLVAAVCRAVDDTAWLESCLKSIDHSKLD